ncbi:MAG: Asp23/Gls24 family envelope stress response protein [Clostridiales bacterium]|nr:Asp23/Gls24 family envelope stress response protein [Clostridiales bacterium]
MADQKKNDVQTSVENGTVTFANEVLAVIGGLAANEVEGVAGMSGGGGIAEMFSKKNLGKGVKITLSERTANIDVTLIATYGYKIHEVCATVQQNVKKAIENMTGLDVASVNVHVSGIVFDKKEEPILAEEPDN